MKLSAYVNFQPALTSAQSDPQVGFVGPVIGLAFKRTYRIGIAAVRHEQAELER